MCDFFEKAPGLVVWTSRTWVGSGWPLDGALENERPRRWNQMAPAHDGLCSAHFCEEQFWIEPATADDGATRNDRCEKARNNPSDVI